MTPEDWPLVTLGRVADILIGGTPSRNNSAYWDSEKVGNNRWVSISDLKGRVVRDTAEYITDLGVAKSNVKLLPAGTPIMSFKLTIGRAAITGTNLYTNEAIAGFFSRGEVDPAFLMYALPRAAEEGGEADVAVKGKTLNKAKLLELPMLLPPLAEQRKIAAILSSVDDAIEAAQAVIDQLQVVKKAMMAELLTRGMPGRHTRFKQTEIGEVPHEWTVLTVQECLDRGVLAGHQDGNHGGDYPRKNEFGNEGLPFLSAKHLDENHSVMSCRRHVFQRSARRSCASVSRERVMCCWLTMLLLDLLGLFRSGMGRCCWGHR